MKSKLFSLLPCMITALFLCCVANAEIVAEVGPNFVLGDYSESETLLIQKRWQGKYSVGIGYMSAHCLDNRVYNVTCEWEISEQLMFGAERRFSWRRWSFGLGLYYVDTTSRISSAKLNARSSLEFAATEHFAFKISHLSNGGTGPTKTVCNKGGWCYTGKSNLGINTLALVWKF